LAVVGDRLVPLSQLFVDFRPRLVRISILGRQRHGPNGIRQALGVTPGLVVIPGAVVVGDRIIGLELYRLGGIGDGGVQVATVLCRDPSVEL